MIVLPLSRERDLNSLTHLTPGTKDPVCLQVKTDLLCEQNLLYFEEKTLPIFHKRDNLFDLQFGFLHK